LSARLIEEIKLYQEKYQFLSFIFVLNEVLVLARLPRLDTLHGEISSRLPRLSQVRSQLNGLARLSCKVKLFCVGNYYEAGRPV
jgi:hypothetical protein